MTIKRRSASDYPAKEESTSTHIRRHLIYNLKIGDEFIGHDVVNAIGLASNRNNYSKVAATLSHLIKLNFLSAIKVHKRGYQPHYVYTLEEYPELQPRTKPKDCHRIRTGISQPPHPLAASSIELPSDLSADLKALTNEQLEAAISTGSVAIFERPARHVPAGVALVQAPSAPQPQEPVPVAAPVRAERLLDRLLNMAVEVEMLDRQLRAAEGRSVANATLEELLAEIRTRYGAQ